MIRLPPGAYLTATAADRGFRAARIVETTYAGGQVLPHHVHEHTYLVVMIAGTLLESCRGEEHVLTRGTLVFNAVGEAHANRVGPGGARCLNVELEAGFVRDLGAAHSLPRCGFGYRHAGPAIRAVGALIAAVATRGDDATVDDALIELLSGIDGDTVSVSRFSWLSTAIDFVHAHWRTGASVRAMGQALGIAPAHLCRSFRAAVGCTAGEYARRLRADAAHAQIAAGTPLAVVATDCGFADQSHMTRDLRRRYGISPGDLRRGFA